MLGHETGSPVFVDHVGRQNGKCADAIRALSAPVGSSSGVAGTDFGTIGTVVKFMVAERGRCNQGVVAIDDGFAFAQV